MQLDQLQPTTRQSPDRQGRRFIYRCVDAQNSSATPHPMRRCTDSVPDFTTPPTPLSRKNIEATIHIVASQKAHPLPTSVATPGLHRPEPVLTLSIDIQV